MAENSTRLLSTAPHIRTKLTMPVVMWSVVLALVPAGAWAVYAFGWSVMVVIGVSVGAAVLSELLINVATGKEITIWDGSAFLTGLLVAYNMPASAAGNFPFYIPIVASVFAIAVAKHAFGGLGQNWMNPALAGRIFVFYAWATPMTSNWATAFQADVVTSATAAKALKFGGVVLPSYMDMFLGKMAGCIGEVSAAALLLGGIFLVVRKIINWEIPVFYIGTVALLAWVFGGLNVAGMKATMFAGDPLYHILAGGVMLGAIFMATDWVTSPFTFKGRIIYAVGCGVITILIRLTARNVEGVSFAIVLMNIVVPLIDRVTKLPKFGIDKKRKTA